MGIVIREFLCRDCGNTFESSDNPEDIACPVCSAEEPERVFLTPTSVSTGNTSRKDTILKELADSYKLSDMSNKDGQPVRRMADRPNPATFANNGTIMQNLQKLGPAADNFSGMLGKFGTPKADIMYVDKKNPKVQGR